MFSIKRGDPDAEFNSEKSGSDALINSSGLIGRLGHMAIKQAKAMGAEVTVVVGKKAMLKWLGVQVFLLRAFQTHNDQKHQVEFSEFGSCKKC